MEKCHLFLWGFMFQIVLLFVDQTIMEDTNTLNNEIRQYQARDVTIQPIAVTSAADQMLMQRVGHICYFASFGVKPIFFSSC